MITCRTRSDDMVDTKVPRRPVLDPRMHGTRARYFLHRLSFAQRNYHYYFGIK